MDKTIRGLLILLAMSVLMAGAALAAVPSGATISGKNNEGFLPVNASVDVVNLSAGNITAVNLASTMSTYKWAGLYGNASGSLRLGSAAAFVMYTWAARSNMIYAATATPNWVTLATSGQSGVEGNYTFLTGQGTDGYNTTFIGAPELINSNIFPITAPYASTLSYGGLAWKTYALGDRTNVVFAGKVQQNNPAFNGKSADFQMIIPENGATGQETATPWNLWLELI
jgi:hypothetical protein